ncbi:2-hydroxychromene-2-carboxylate isomerase [Arenibaculum pallidiluteum]|uniref:2-hydroxychromene-2-carboxylate isomerase n=1 Tax=Arenibaculum pallidiluteum TaxID=2812559 RepID=UPI001A963C60|nr:2-hydroxychromene-2-carboxylate isomerase [Arenibaculum pallidiluteum]
MAPPLEFYFDFASPYGYLAATQVDAMAARHGRTVAWRPVLLGAIFKLTGMRPVVEQPLRREYLLRDAGRFARLLGVPLTVPPVVPANPLVASRAFWWLHDRDEAAAARFARAIYDAHWGQGRDISPSEAVLAIAAEQGLDTVALRDGVSDGAVKARLRAETERAIARGVFGAPFLFVDGEPFWGADRLDQVERWMAAPW